MIKNNQSGATMLPFIVAIVGGIAIAWIISVLVSIDDTELDARSALNGNQVDTFDQQGASSEATERTVRSDPNQMAAGSTRQPRTADGTPNLAEQLQAVRLQLERMELGASAGPADSSLAEGARVQQLEAQLRNAEVKIDELTNRIRITDPSNPVSMNASLKSTIRKASTEDRNYIRALDGNVETYITTDSQRIALSNVGTEKVDYLNRIMLSNTGDNSNKQASDTLERSVMALMTDIDKNKSQQSLGQHRSYLKALDPLQQQRANESRTYTVRQGDSLWDIAVRAYGDGFLYIKIFYANPQILTNPDLIVPGQILRVPI